MQVLDTCVRTLELTKSLLITTLFTEGKEVFIFSETTASNKKRKEMTIEKEKKEKRKKKATQNPFWRLINNS